MSLKNTFLTLLILCSLVTRSIGQQDRSIHIGVSGALPNELGSSQLFLASDLQLGLQFEMSTGNVKAFGAYQLFGNMSKEVFEAYTFASQQLGVGFEYQSNNEKIVSLIVGASFMTEIYTNFKNGYMNNGNLAFPRSVRPYAGNYYATNFQKHEYKFYDSHHYQSTPLSVSIWLGMNVRLYKSLNINFSILNDIRVISQKYFKWDLTDKEEEQINLIGKDINELIDDQAISRTVIDRFGLRVGLSYTLPISKTK